MTRLGIGLPVYNGERYLAATLASLRAQTYDDFEVLILDNASTDRTGNIVEAVTSVDPRFRYHRKPVTTGGPTNFNDAFRAMDNELFAWCAADDLHHPDFFAACVASLDARPDAIGAFTAVEVIDADGNWVRDDAEPVRWGDPDPVLRMRDLASYRHSCQSIFSVLRRPVLAAVSPMCDCWGSDRVMLAELALHGPVVVRPERYFRNRDHSGRVTRRGRRSGAYYGAARPYRALTFHYATHLRRAISHAPLSSGARLRAWGGFAGWAAANTGNLARSAVRGTIELVRPAPVQA